MVVVGDVIPTEYTNGVLEFCRRFEEAGNRTKEFMAELKKYDLLRHYNEKKPKAPDSGLILAGVSSQPAGKTRDGWYTRVFIDYLKPLKRQMITRKMQKLKRERARA